MTDFIAANNWKIFNVDISKFLFKFGEASLKAEKFD